MSYITIKEFAEKENLPLESIRRMCKRNILPSIKAGHGYYVNFERAEAALKEMETTPIKTQKKRKGRIVPGHKEPLTSKECIDELTKFIKTRK